MQYIIYPLRTARPYFINWSSAIHAPTTVVNPYTGLLITRACACVRVYVSVCSCVSTGTTVECRPLVSGTVTQLGIKSNYPYASSFLILLFSQQTTPQP